MDMSAILNIVYKMLKLVVLLTVLGTALAFPSINGGRIVGGNDATIEDYPSVLVLMSSGRFFCGAVLVDPEWALTAASCVTSATASQLSIRAGSASQTSGGQVVSVASIVVSPEYNNSTHDSDLALLQLAEEVTVETAAVALLPEGFDFLRPGEPVEVAGWGNAESGGDTSEVLQVAELAIVGREECEGVYGTGSITENMICAAYEEGGRDACQGDSGGPLIARGHVIGIVSWGYSVCGTAGYPGVYADVSRALPWIYENTGNEPSPPSPPSDWPSPPSDWPSPPSDWPSPPSDWPSPPSDWPSPPSDWPSPPSGMPSPPSDMPSPPSDMPSPPKKGHGLRV